MEVVIRTYCGLNAIHSPDYMRIKNTYESKLYDRIIESFDKSEAKYLVANDFGVKVELATLCKCKFIGINVPNRLMNAVMQHMNKAIEDLKDEVLYN